MREQIFTKQIVATTFIWSGMKSPDLWLLLFILLIPFLNKSATAQSGGGHTLWGDIKVDESKVGGLKPMNFELTLYETRGGVVARQRVTKGGRYRFEELRNGDYVIVLEMENTEVARVRAIVQAAVSTDFRQDISLEWRANPSTKKEDAGVVSAVNHYARAEPNNSLFKKAEKAIKKGSHSQAISLLRQIVAGDSKDFEAWTELGTMYFIQKDSDEAEKAYLLALEAQPSFILALLNLGKLRLAQKKYAGAIEILTKAVTVPPPSAEASYFLGEAYLGIGKGSKAVDYMNEALRIDPVGKAEIQLRIAAIYDNVGLKELAAGEYEKFLQQRSDYPEKKKLQKYIAENKKR